MCMFCAAIPATAAVGAAARAKQIRESKAQGLETPAPAKPVILFTMGAVTLLLVGSVIYHISWGNP